MSPDDKVKKIARALWRKPDLLVAVLKELGLDDVNLALPWEEVEPGVYLRKRPDGIVAATIIKGDDGAHPVWWCKVGSGPADRKVRSMKEAVKWVTLGLRTKGYAILNPRKMP
jgi:hypothetical protein